MIQIREALRDGRVVGFFASTIEYPYYIRPKEAFGSCRVEALENLLAMLRADQEAITKIASKVSVKIDEIDGCDTEKN